MKPPMGLKMPQPKAEVDAIPLARKPVPTAGGKDIISITTRMRETPMKKGK
jgi:hypothetical protein